MKQFLILSAALLLQAIAASSTARAGIDGKFNVYVTNQALDEMPVNNPGDKFACREKIYGVVEISGAQGDTAEHVLYATWRNPSGDDQEITKYPFHLTNGGARVWVWLKLHRSAESSLTQFMNPSGGLEEFAGQWTLQIRIDDQDIDTKHFELLC
jgi:hypothetical protein